jgi:DNA invertase Pin-like site-specific DNA recombinase
VNTDQSTRLIGYSRCARSTRDRIAQDETLTAAGCHRVHFDTGLTGQRQQRTELDAALASARAGDIFVVPCLARLVTSVDDAVAIFRDLDARGLHLQADGHVFSWPDPAEREAFIHGLAVAGALANDLLRLRTRVGVDAARSAGRTRDYRRKLTEAQRQEIRDRHATGSWSFRRLAKAYDVSTATVSRAVHEVPAGITRPPRTASI